jgi:hypothetical protein
MVRLNNTRLFAAVAAKALFIPPEGWRAHHFRVHGVAMIRTLHRVSRIARAQATSGIVRSVTSAFREQIDTVLERFAARTRVNVVVVPRGSSMFKADIFLPQHEDMILDILNQVLAETGDDVTAKIVPGVQSTLAQGYSKTSILLGQTPDPRANIGLQRRAQGLASRITNISQTTRTRFQTILKTAVKEGWSVPETATAIQERLPRIQAARALTIARTELNNAWTQGAVQSYRESKTLTQVSVIGCESREQDRWDEPSYQQYLYRGESTCNIQGVPVADMDKLEFHINHTGTMVPSGFVE